MRYQRLASVSGLLLACCCIAATLLVATPSSAAGDSTTTIAPLGDPIMLHGPSTADANSDESAVASDGTDFLAVWAAAGVPYAARVSSSGQVLDASGIQLGSSAAGTPNVVFNGTDYFVVWVNSSGDIQAARIHPDGTLLDSTPLTLVAGVAKPRMVGVAFDGTNYLVVWRTLGDAIQGQRVSLTGQPQDDSFQISSHGYYPFVAFGGGQFLVVWYDSSPNRLIFGARVSTGGSVLDPGGFTIDPTVGDQGHPSVASDGTDFLVAWHEPGAANAHNDGTVRATRVSAAGVVLDAPALLVGEYDIAGTATIAIFDGTDYLVTWQMYMNPENYRLTDAFGRRISTSGELVDQQPIGLANSTGHQWGPTVAAGGDRYLVTWSENGTPVRCNNSLCLYGHVFQKVSVATAPPSVTPTSPLDAGWSAASSPTGNAIDGLWAFDQSHIFALSEGQSIFRSDGSTWSSALVSTNIRYGIWGTSPSDVWATGWCGDIGRYDGATWDETGCRTNRMYIGVWDSDPLHVFAVGAGGELIRYQGTNLGASPQLDLTNWHEQASPVSADLWDVWGAAANDVYAVGELGTIIHWDGSSWSRITNVPSYQSLNAIWGTGPDDIFAVGDSGTILHYDGSGWTYQASETNENLTGVSGTSGANVYAVGFNGTILYYDGADWTPEVSGTTEVLSDVAVAGNTVWAVGDSGTVLKKVADVTPNGTSIDSGPSGPSNDSTPSFTFSSSRAGSTFQCSLDGGSFQVCQPPHTTTALADGAHSFAVKATDPSDNSDATAAVRSFTVDTVPPETTIDSGPSGSTNDSTPTFAFSSSETGSTFQCSLDGGSFQVCQPPHTTTALADGAHSFAVKATDPSDNSDATAAVRSFTVDTVPPETTIDSGPSGSTNDSTPTFAFSSSETGSSFRCSLDGAAFQACSSPHTTGTLANGAHSFAVEATDQASNTDLSAAVRSFTVDTTPPPGAGSTTPVKKSGKVFAHLTKTTFTRAQAATVVLVYRFSAKSKSFRYLLTRKKGAGWLTVRNAMNRGSFSGSHRIALGRIFGNKRVVAGRYRLKLFADSNQILLTFRVT